jgi:hypothetical protein
MLAHPLTGGRETWTTILPMELATLSNTDPIRMAITYDKYACGRSRLPGNSYLVIRR